jgi:hypothetical protein
MLLHFRDDQKGLKVFIVVNRKSERPFVIRVDFNADFLDSAAGLSQVRQSDRGSA